MAVEFLEGAAVHGRRLLPGPRPAERDLHSCGPGSATLPIALGQIIVDHLIGEQLPWVFGPAHAYFDPVPFVAVTGNVPTSGFNAVIR
jgi:hypothetical protein